MTTQPEPEQSPTQLASPDGDPEHETPVQRRQRRAAVIWLILFVGGIYLLAMALGVWLWMSGRLES